MINLTIFLRILLFIEFILLVFILKNALSGASSHLLEHVIHNNWYYWYEYKKDLYLPSIQNFLYIWSPSGGKILLILNILFFFLTLDQLRRFIQRIFLNNTENALIAQFVVFSLFLSILNEINIVWFFYELPYMEYFFLLTSIFFLGYYNDKNTKEIYFYIAYISALLTLFSSNYGFLTFVVLFIQSILQKIDKKKQILLLGSCITLMFIDPLNISLFFSIQQHSFVDILSYFLTYIGGAFFYISGRGFCISLSVIMGVLFLGLYLYSIYRNIILGKNEQFYNVFLALFTFFILKALVVTVINLQLPVYQLYKHHDLSFSFIVWGMVFIYVMKIILNEFPQKISVVYYVAIAISMMIFVYQFYIFNERKNIINLYKQKVAIESINSELISSLHWIAKEASFISKKQYKTNKDIFALVEAVEPLVKSNLGVFKHRDDIIIAIENIQRLNTKPVTLKIVGWVYNIKKQKLPSELYIVDKKGKISGMITIGLQRKDLVKKLGMKMCHCGFEGFIVNFQKSETYFLVNPKNNILRKIDFN